MADIFLWTFLALISGSLGYVIGYRKGRYDVVTMIMDHRPQPPKPDTSIIADGTSVGANVPESLLYDDNWVPDNF